MKSKRSLIFKLMIWINIVSIITMVALSASIMFNVLKSTEKTIDQEMWDLADSMKLASTGYVKSLNKEALKNITSQFLDNPSIEEVSFLDSNNSTLAEAREPHAGVYKNIKQPIFSEGDKKVIGYIEISYNLNKVQAVKDEFYKKTIIGVVAAQLFIYLIFYFILKSTTTKLGAVSQKLREISHKNQESSDRVKKISEAVSSSTNDQASSIQETVSTLDEITSMVNTSVDSAKSSTLKAEESHRIANDGKEVVKEMIFSMEEINHSNKDIMDEIQRSNGRIAEIVKVINEISTKTSVINDIVFQTKLLSFNASVEAARAGEHGKGFAVVAEEVGNLARMSGTASNEISQMLSDSINKVNSIIEETNKNIVRLIDAGNQKVSSGVAVADRCGKVLDEVVENATIVKTMMNEVSLACKEQAEGIKNIAMAMNQLDQTTLNNTETAKKSFENSKEMALQSDELQYSVRELEQEIFGSKGYVVEAKKEASPVISKKVIEDKRVGAKAEVKSSVLKEATKPSTPEAKVEKLPVRAVEKKAPKSEVKKEVMTDNIVDIKKKTNVSAAAPAVKSAGKKVGGSLGIDVPLADDSRFEDV